MTGPEFEALVQSAIDDLPDDFRRRLENVDIVIEESPDMREAERLGLGARGRLLGLYQGIPLKDRTHYYGMVLPDKITLYRANIERTCREAGTKAADEVAHVLRHEIAHHFGISDRRLRDIGTY